jgi:CRISPR-associated protein Csm5
MTSESFRSHALRITPLTPVHIGCGIDLDPTQYVIDERSGTHALFAFQPSAVPLDQPGRDALKRVLAQTGDVSRSLLGVQNFFHERREDYTAAAHQLIAVSGGVAREYAARVGAVAQKPVHGSDVINQLTIERTAHNPYSGSAYLPGSSLKGSIRTAWLNQLNGMSASPKGERANVLEKRLLAGSFHTDPFRLVKVADATGSNVASRIAFAANHKKKSVADANGNVRLPKGVTTRREFVVGAQFRALDGEIRFDLLPGTEGAEAPARNRRLDWNSLARACNDFYRPRLKEELETLGNRELATEAWLAEFNTLLAGIAPALDSGNAFLLRVGRHAGANAVTIDGVRDIKIMQGPGKQPLFSPVGGGTLWLAAENAKDSTNMLPIGWVLVERADASAIPGLEAWCDQQEKPNLAQLHAALAEERAHLQARLKQQAETQALAAAERETAAAAEAARERALAALGPNGRKVQELVHEFQQRNAQNAKKDKPNQGLHQKAQTLVREAMSSDWSAEDKVALASALEEWIPKAVACEWKDERKKLKIAALKGQA